MLTQPRQATKSLYETDYHLWVMETLSKLEKKDFDSLDLENLIEEVLDLSRRQKKKLKSLLRNLFEHLLKLKYWQAEQNNNSRHWQGEITNFRKQIKDELEDSPSLVPYLLEVLDECYRDGRAIAAAKSGLAIEVFPEKAIANLEQILDESWLP